MAAADARGVTELLLAGRDGDESALDDLTPIVYEELHRIARRCMAGERGEHSLQATALVNEAYLKLVDTRRVSLDETALVSPEPEVDLVDLDAALRKLAARDPRKERVVELRFFAGLEVRETADVLEVSPETVMRDLRLARAWLARELERGRGDSPDRP